MLCRKIYKQSFYSTVVFPNLRHFIISLSVNESAAKLLSFCTFTNESVQKKHSFTTFIRVIPTFIRDISAF